MSLNKDFAAGVLAVSCHPASDELIAEAIYLSGMPSIKSSQEN